MRKGLIGLAFASAVLTSGAEAPSEREPAALLAPLPEAIHSLSYHLRLKPLRTASATAALVWNADSAGERRVEFDIPPVNACDPQTGFESAYRLFDNDSLLCAGKFRAIYPTGDGVGLSAILKADAAGASVSFGASEIVLTLPVDYSRDSAGLIGYSCSRPLEELRNDVRYVAAEPPRYAPYGTVEALIHILETSDDPAEGVWSFLDRDTDPEYAFPGGEYRLATVADSAGGYLIVYLGGAVYGASDWQPLRIKGRLVPSGFDGNFDLEWFDVTGRRAGREASATLEVGKRVLRLDFPLHRAVLRFRREKL